LKIFQSLLSSFEKFTETTILRGRSFWDLTFCSFEEGEWDLHIRRDYFERLQIISETEVVLAIFTERDDSECEIRIFFNLFSFRKMYKSSSYGEFQEESWTSVARSLITPTFFWYLRMVSDSKVESPKNY
jgi:hypothetical protein